MSKIGKKIINIPEGIKVAIKDGVINIKNSKNELNFPILPGVTAKHENNILNFSLIQDYKQARSNWGTLRALVNNAILGLTKEFEKILILEGVGYRMAKEGNNLVLNLGFSHPVKFQIPSGINMEVEKNSILKITGFDKALVGQIAAEIRALKKPEPYKGKGIHYSDETIRRKAGKKAATTTTA